MSLRRVFLSSPAPASPTQQKLPKLRDALSRLRAGLRRPLPPYARTLFAYSACLALVVASAWAILTLSKGIELRSFEQHLSDSSTDGLGTSLVAQSFRSQRANLSSVELELSSKTALPRDGGVRLLVGDGLTGAVVYSASLNTANFDKNPYLSFGFPPIASSEGMTYTLAVETPGRPLNSAIGARYNSFDALSSGRMYTDAGAGDGDLSLNLFYHHDLSTLLRDVGSALDGQGALVISWLLLLLLPGLALLSWLPNSLSAGQRLLAAPGVTALALPVFFLVLRALCLTWGGVASWVLLAVCAILVALCWLLYRPTTRPRRPVASDLAFWGLLLGVLALTLASRLLSLRDAYAGMGLDAYHHTLIAEMFARAGGIPSNYQPYAPLASFTYHFGFHALTATVGWLSGHTSPGDMLTLMPQAGQIATTLPVLTLALFGWKALGNRWAGLAAGGIAGLVSILPAFYVNWSRYTQGLGLALLPVAWVLLLEVLEQSTAQTAAAPGSQQVTWQSALGRSGPFMLAVVGAAGLALTHYRIEMIYALFVALYLLWRLLASIRARKPLLQAIGQLWRAGLVAVLTLAALSPWLVNLRQNFTTHLVNKVSSDTAGYYDFQGMLGPDVLNHPSLPIIFVLALAGLVVLARRRDVLLLGCVLALGLLVLFPGPRDSVLTFIFSLGGLVRSPDWAIPLFIFLLALGTLLLAARGRDPLPLLPALAWLILGLWSTPYLFPVRLPYAGYLDASTLASGAWLPLSILAGYAVAAAGRWVLSLGDTYRAARQRAWRVSASALMAAAVLLGSAASGLSLSSLIDMKPYMAQADAEALAWMREHLPRDAYVMANPFAFPWAPTSVQGQDAGLWVPLVAGVRASVPPIPAYNERLADPNYLSGLLGLVRYEPYATQQADWQALHAAGITHIYVGSRGNAFAINRLLTSDQVTLVYHKDAVWVFALR